MNGVPFEDRESAGRRLADLLKHHDVDADVVLAVPRGGLPVARPVADALDATLDIVAAKKMGAPGNAEFAIGAAAADGSVWLHDETIAELGVDEAYIAEERDRAAETAERKVDRYRGDRNPPELAGRSVVLVDDGVATGATMRACVEQVTNAGADECYVAVPVGSPESLSNLGPACDGVYAVESPPHFRAVGQFYRDFEQVTDEEAVAYLDWDADVTLPGG